MTKKAKKAKFSYKQNVFMDELMVDNNQTHAAIRAGYSKKTAAVQASKMLTLPKIAEEIARRRATHAKRLHLSSDQVLENLALMAGANMEDFVTLTSGGDPYIDILKLTRNQMYALQEITIDDYVDGRGDDTRAVKRIKLKISDRHAANVTLAKHLGLLKERIELGGVDGAPITARIERVIVDPKEGD